MPEGSEKQWHRQGNSATSHVYNLRSRLNWGCLWALRESWHCPTAQLGPFPPSHSHTDAFSRVWNGEFAAPHVPPSAVFALSKLSSASRSAQAGFRLPPLPRLLSKAVEYKPRQGLVRASGEGSCLRPLALPWGELPPFGVPSPNDPMPTGQQQLLQRHH